MNFNPFRTSTEKFFMKLPIIDSISLSNTSMHIVDSADKTDILSPCINALWPKSPNPMIPI